MKKNNELYTGPRIYNLFPRLLGKMENWVKHFDRIKDLGFDWIYINPFHYPGFSGSLYAPKDYYDFNPLFIDSSSKLPPMKQLEKVLDEAHKRDLKVIMDLVINHTSKDHPFIKIHPEWYLKDENGNIKSPGAMDNGKWIEWGDLAEIDNENSPDKENLWNYWKELVLFYLDKGFDGFRADAAYKIPSELWVFLIDSAKEENHNVKFFAESLGCTPEQTYALAKSGFDYIFNSSKWWNFNENWLIEQLNLTKDVVPSISFPESHDTIRLSMEYNNNMNAIKQRTIFTALFSSGWMIPIGFEYGFRKKLDVVKTYPSDWEPINYDITNFIKSLNNLKKSYNIFNEDNTVEIVPIKENWKNVIVLKKVSKNQKEKVLMIINKDINYNQTIFLDNIYHILDIPTIDSIKDISLDYIQEDIPLINYNYILRPGEVKLLYYSSKS